MVNLFDDIEKNQPIIQDDTQYNEVKSKELKLTDWLNSINFNKNYLMNKNNEKKYPQFLINSILSKNRELIFYIEALNNLEMNNQWHYDFLLNAIPSSKRFIPFFNKKIKINEDIELVKKYYNVSYKRAVEYYNKLDENDIMKLKSYYDEGGIKK